MGDFTQLGGLPSEESIDRFLSGEGSLEERQAVRQWGGRTPQGEARADIVLESVRTRSDASDGEPVRTFDSAALLVAVKQRIDHNAKVIHRRRATTSLPRVITRSIAVCVAVVLVASLWKSVVSRPYADHTYTTAPGQRATVTLADGSRMILGPATAVSIENRRASINQIPTMVVRMIGAAQFSVTSRHDRAFEVHTGNAIARVLGTTFTVRRYDTDAVTRVLVRDGRVSLAATHAVHQGVPRIPPYVLTASMLGTVTDSAQILVQPNVTSEESMGLTDDRLVFHRTPVDAAVVELGRVYGVDLRIADSATRAQTLNWSVTLSQRSLNDVLESLGLLLDVHPIRTGHVITLVPGRTMTPHPVDPRSLSLMESQHGK